MIVLDTNIASVILDPEHGDLPGIIEWQKASGDRDFRITAVTRAEIAYGIAILPDGVKKRRLVDAAGKFLAAAADWTLPFGTLEADAYAVIAATRRTVGRPISVFDAQIAATARVAGAVVATRDTKGFAECGVAVINPYESRAR